MREHAILRVVTLRGRAAHCREIARNAFSETIASEMLLIAEQYEREAEDTLDVAGRELMELRNA